jgi:hypothetical protein
MSVDADWSAIRDHEELHADDWEHQLTVAENALTISESAKRVLLSHHR